MSEHTLLGVKTMQRKKGRIISAVNNNQEVSITQIKKNKQDVIKTSRQLTKTIMFYVKS